MIANELIGKQFAVLDHGSITLRDALPLGEDMEARCVEISRLSYGNRKRVNSDEGLWGKLITKGGAHVKALEFVRFDFEIIAPVVVFWQWDTYRHRTFFSESGRRVALEQFYIPECEPEQRQRIEHLYANAVRLYEGLIDEGVKREQARLVLPFGAAYYKRRYSVDGKSLLHFLSQRLEREAQWEIRQYALAIYTHIYKPLLPIAAQTVAHLAE